jgi:hypothetical protein
VNLLFELTLQILVPVADALKNGKIRRILIEDASAQLMPTKNMPGCLHGAVYMVYILVNERLAPFPRLLKEHPHRLLFEKEAAVCVLFSV